MAHFYGRVKAAIHPTGEATRTGTKDGGLRVEAMSYTGRIVVTLEHRDGQDHYTVTLTDHPLEDYGKAILLSQGTFPKKGQA